MLNEVAYNTLVQLMVEIDLYNESKYHLYFIISFFHVKIMESVDLDHMKTSFHCCNVCLLTSVCSGYYNLIIAEILKKMH